MSKIKVLPKSVYSKIAAGEVIERPASVVRELLDNAIDSGAKKIVVKIEGGGIDKIVVSDDGSGINKDEMPLALSIHATSKIENIDDLLKISTMGFRGEALYSIQTVSKLSITSNTDETGASPGYKLANFGKEQDKLVSVAHKKGTKVEVTDLFYNLPARKKFLKSKVSEWNALKAVVFAKVFSYLDVSFALYHNNELVFTTKGDGDFKEAFFALYKNEPSFSIDKYAKFEHGVRIELYYTNPETFFQNRKYQTLYVNKRPVSASFFYASIDTGIREYISPGRHPLVFCYLDIDPKLLDINIHPAKKEIKFVNQNEIFTLIQGSLKEALGKMVSREIFTPLASNYSTKESEKQLDFYKEQETVSLSMDYFNEVIDRKPGFQHSTPTLEPRPTVIEEKNYQILGVVFDTYIVIEKDGKVLFIDQHAACEAIIFQKKKAKYANNKDTEKLIIPTLFDLDNWDSNVEKRMESLNNSGFLLERGEGATIAVRELPSILLNKKDYDTLIEIIKDFLESSGNIEESKIIDNILIEASCKEAVKKGDKLSLLEITEIVDEYFKLGITNCPHGRPSHFELSKDHLEKVFQRKK